MKFIVTTLVLLAMLSSLGGLFGTLYGTCEERHWSFVAGACQIGPVAFLIAFLTAKRRFAPSRAMALVTFLPFFVCTMGMFVLVFPAPPEGKLLFYSDIDTRFAPDYSDAQFSQVRVGMTTGVVRRLLGEPSFRVYLTDVPYEHESDDLWFYACDGACTWGDFAWRAPIVGFRGGIVVTNYMRWTYD